MAGSHSFVEPNEQNEWARRREAWARLTHSVWGWRGREETKQRTSLLIGSAHGHGPWGGEDLGVLGRVWEEGGKWKGTGDVCNTINNINK